jgi:hypothetical protein
MRARFALALAVALAASPAGAQQKYTPGGAAYVASGQQQDLGFCPLSGMSASTSLTSCPTQVSTGSNYTGGIPTNATYAVICAYVQGVVFRADGGTPTGTPGSGGQGIAAGQCLPYPGTPAAFAALRFIQQASGALLGVSWYQ